MGAEFLTGSRETANDFIGDQKDIVLIQHLLNGRPVPLWGRNDAAGPKCRFSDKGCNRIWALSKNKGFKFVGAAFGEAFFGFALMRLAIVMWRGCMVHQVQRQVKKLMEERKACQATRNEPGAVITTMSRDDLGGATENVVVVPGELDIGLVGVGTGQAEINPSHVLSEIFDHGLRQTGNRLGALAGINMRKWQVMRLLGNGVSYLRASIPC